MCPVLCQYRAVLIIITLQHILKSGSTLAPALFLFTRDCFGFFVVVVVPYKFQDCFYSFVKNVIVFDGITLNLYIILGRMNILTVVGLLIHEHKMPFTCWLTIYDLNYVAVFLLYLIYSKFLSRKDAAFYRMPFLYRFR
jgi:hypothetical protein